MINYSTKAEIIAAIGKNRRVVSGPGCGTPGTLLRLIGEEADFIAGSTIFSGLLLGDFPFVQAVQDRLIRYATWHVMPPIRRLVAEGAIDLYPLRASQIPALLERLNVDVALIRVSPPNRHGYCNLGPSVSYLPSILRRARTIIAEVSDDVPLCQGEGWLPWSRVAHAIPSEQPMASYDRVAPDPVSRAIAKHIVPLLPDRPTLQIGIGSIPEAFVSCLLEQKIGDLRFAGMAVDGFADLHDAGLLADTFGEPKPPVIAAELMGSRTLMDFANDNPALRMEATERGINAAALSPIPRFVSINSAIELDRMGNVSSEVAGGKQISGVGGSVDFVEAAIHSEGGMRVLALPARDLRSARSKIVQQLPVGSSATLSRHSAGYVVTEFGVADLALSSLRERAKQLAAIAHPEDRDSILEVAQ